MSDQTCSIPLCFRPVLARTWCTGHYRRWRLYGDPGGELLPTKAPAEERFWFKVNKSGPRPVGRPNLGECWLWLGAVAGGYGRFAPANRVGVQAHRFAYELVIGPIPPGLVLDHLCNVQLCVNPQHLDPTTQRENVARGSSPIGERIRRAS